MKLWAGRFKKETSALVDEYCASIEFDQTLAEFDIQGSLAHVSMLGKCSILKKETVALITNGLQEIRKALKKGELTFRVSDEDIHMNIERMLHDLIGEEAGKLHTGRSRNDQVALDLRLYLRHHVLKTVGQLTELNTVIVMLAEKYSDVIMPGYTHLQRAEPVRFSHHMMAYFNMFYRDTQRLMECFARVNVCPLGAGALAGSGVAVDRDTVAQLLNFDGVTENSLDTVSDRDFVAEFLFNASLVMMHLSKMSEEIILWCSQEFSFIQLDDQYCTGSSMMPQKKNPDVAEVARGKTGRVYGSLMGLLTVLKGLPLAYNKDLQEDKEGLFDTVKTVRQTLSVYTGMLDSMQLNKEKMEDAVSQDYSNATQLANYMTEKGIPFREAHKITGNIVAYCIDHHKQLSELSLGELKGFCDSIEDEVYALIQHESVVESHAAKGGTAKQCVLDQIKEANKKLDEINVWYEKKLYNLIYNTDERTVVA